MITVAVPGGCRWCGVPERVHYRRWSQEYRAVHGNGWHFYERPTDMQLKERLQARRRQ